MDSLPGGKVSPPLPTLICSLILCYDKRDWEEPSYMKFLKALQEYTGNIFSYLVSVNIVNICLWWGVGDNLPRGKVSPPPQPSCWLSFLCNDQRAGGGGTVYPMVKCPSPQSSCMLSFLYNDQRDWEQPGHLKFLNALQEDAANKLAYLVPANSFMWWSKGLRRAWVEGGHLTPG